MEEQINKVRKQISSLIWEYGKCCWENCEDDGEQPDSFPVSVEIKSLIQPLIEHSRKDGEHLALEKQGQAFLEGRKEAAKEILAIIGEHIGGGKYKVDIDGAMLNCLSGDLEQVYGKLKQSIVSRYLGE